MINEWFESPFFVIVQIPGFCSSVAPLNIYIPPQGLDRVALESDIDTILSFYCSWGQWWFWIKGKNMFQKSAPFSISWIINECLADLKTQMVLPPFTNDKMGKEFLGSIYLVDQKFGFAPKFGIWPNFWEKSQFLGFATSQARYRGKGFRPAEKSYSSCCCSPAYCYSPAYHAFTMHLNIWRHKFEENYKFVEVYYFVEVKS